MITAAGLTLTGITAAGVTAAGGVSIVTNISDAVEGAQDLILGVIGKSPEQKESINITRDSWTALGGSEKGYNNIQIASSIASVGGLELFAPYAGSFNATRNSKVNLTQNNSVKNAEAGEVKPKLEIVDKTKKTFKINDWDDYPDDYVPLPDKNKTWQLLEGDAYNNARKAANNANRKIAKANPDIKANELEIHEIEPVKMGGSPIDPANKIGIQGKVHRKYVTPWWNRIRDAVKDALK